MSKGKNKRIRFVVIYCFATPGFKDLVVDVLTKGLKLSVGDFPLRKELSSASRQSKLRLKQVPLILCESLNDLKRRGVLCPDEFVISRKDLLPQVDEEGHWDANPLVILERRLNVLADLYEKEDFAEKLRNWFAGAFRLYLMLDSATHGTSEYIDLKKVRKDGAGKDPILDQFAEKCVRGSYSCGSDEPVVKHAEKLRQRFSPETSETLCDSAIKYRSTFKVLYPEYFADEGQRSLSALVDRKISISKDEAWTALMRIYEDREERDEIRNERDKKLEPLCEQVHVVKLLGHDERLPIAYGERARHVTPSGKLNVLLIDDNVDQSPLSKLKGENVPDDFKNYIHNDDWRLLRRLFVVQPLPIDPGEPDPLEDATEKIRELQKKGLTFNLILVDLCLGKNRNGADLDGYAMIWLVQKFFPRTPVIVYSRFDDMEHIARAFAEGAKWFLVKGMEAKLPRHVLTMLDRPGWHREWDSIRNSSRSPVFDIKKRDELYWQFMASDKSKAWQYLTYKCLEDIPGDHIRIEKMGGGISSAVTFKATKGMRKGDEFLQTPCVIKIDSAYDTMMEHRRYSRRIRPYIANEAGRIEKPEIGIDRENSAIVYTFAGKQNPKHELRSMGSMMDNDVLCRSSCDYEKYRKAIDQIFDEILPKIHQVAPELEAEDYIRKGGSVDVVSSYRSDAFDSTFSDDEISDNENKISTFPNAYFDEVDPKDFWKNYVSRMQPWRRIKVDSVRSFGEQKIYELYPDKDTPATVQEPKPEEEGPPRYLFHDVREDPADPSRKIIEALDKDRKLVWLEGDASDFVARFRRQVFPGDALWVDKNVEANGTDEKETDNQARKIWFSSVLEKNELDGFCKWTLKFMGFIPANGKGEKCKDPKQSPLFNCYTKLQDELLRLAQDVKKNAKEWNCRCPVGIIHGDLNLNNIMLDARIHEARDLAPDTTRTVSDVWLIDFARTRRDIIAHDFNVFFTSTLSRLFSESLLKDSRQVRKLKVCFKALVEGALVGESKGLNAILDCIENDGRMAFIYKILRRCRMAAQEAGVSQNMYLLTTGLACLYSLKIFLNKKRQVELAAGCFVAAWICYDLLVERIGETNVLQDFKKGLLKGGNQS